LTASKFAQGPFRTPLLAKQSPSILITKSLQRSNSLSSVAKISGGVKEEYVVSDSSSLHKIEGTNKLNSSFKKDEKIPLPSVFGDGVIYVSARRYKRILIRRKKRKDQKKYNLIN
jgi:hypothetical protein